ncbi:hypothetical protein LINPERHAP2_LOCUS39448 [Linum perenne]
MRLAGATTTPVRWGMQSRPIAAEQPPSLSRLPALITSFAVLSDTAAEV